MAGGSLATILDAGDVVRSSCSAEATMFCDTVLTRLVMKENLDKAAEGRGGGIGEEKMVYTVIGESLVRVAVLSLCWLSPLSALLSWWWWRG